MHVLKTNNWTHKYEKWVFYAEVQREFSEVVAFFWHDILKNPANSKQLKWKKKKARELRSQLLAFFSRTKNFIPLSVNFSQRDLFVGSFSNPQCRVTWIVAIIHSRRSLESLKSGSRIVINKKRHHRPQCIQLVEHWLLLWGYLHLYYYTEIALFW